ncbi:hypothetical protein EDD36DRAFT_59360 [Exophiala viscosa]|uniref:Uncharacterized protein n=1 Tax=Exophiala viscosa TaxID=2486360 RepID=A0AAN6IBR7_9EURO|nr:hypothetical protein EDD36DRAFT_59360 [Exophiala viscosa]
MNHSSMPSSWFSRAQRSHGTAKSEKATYSTTIVPVSPDRGGIRSEGNPRSPHWNPIWLHGGILSAAVFVSTLAIAILLLLGFLSRKDDGLTLYTTNHFSWTYGPTAVLTMFVAAWRQVDFCCKTLKPWAVLRRGNASAAQSMLLDYTSSLQAVSFYRAVRNKHVIVVTTITGFLVLKLITLASTGLFFPDTVFLSPQQVSLSKATKLDGSLYNSTENQGLFDASIAYTAFAVMAKGLGHANGTANNLVYENTQFDANSGPPGATIVTTVNALIPNFQCQSAPVSVRLQSANNTEPHPEDTLELLFPECTLRNGGNGTSVYALNPRNTVCPERQLSPLLQQIDCVNQTSSAASENWQLLTLADFRYQQKFTNTTDVILGDSIQATSWSTGVQQVTGIACLAGFSMQKVQLSYNFRTEPPTISTEILPGENNTQLGTFSGYDLGVLTTSALTASADMFGNLIDNQAALEYPNTLFKMMAAISGGTYEDLLDESTMVLAAQKVLQQIAIQAVAKNLVSNDNSDVTGSLVESEERLSINNVSLWLMLSGSFVIAVLTCIVLLYRPRDAYPRNPDAIGSIARLVTESCNLRDVLSNIGQGGDSGLKRRLQCSTFGIQSEVDAGGYETMKVKVSAPALAEDREDMDHQHQIQKRQEWWSPLTIKRWMLAITLLLPAVSLVLLEILQRQSDGRKGFTAVSGSSAASLTVYTRFVPALWMLLVATLVNSFDFNITVLAPFNALWSTSSNQQAKGMPISMLGLPPPLALWKSLRNQFWGAFFSGVAAMLGSILTIIVSGLYTIQSLSLSQNVSMNRLDQFNTTWLNSVLNDSSAAVVSSLTESLGLDYPQFTYDELALPKLQMADTQYSVNTSSQTQQLLQIQLPVLRSDLSCVQLAPEAMNVTARFEPEILTASAFVSATAGLPANCPYGGGNGNSTSIQFDWTFTLRGNSSFVGKLIDLHVGPFDAVFASSAGELEPNTQPDNPPDCPSLAFIYGHAVANDPSQTSITTLMCYQYIDQLATNVTFTWPDLAIPTQSAPLVNDSSAKRLSSSSAGQTAFQFRLQLHMDDEFSSFNQSAANTTTTDGSDPPLDNFFQGVLFGRTPVDPSLLAGNSSSDVSQVYSGIRGLYRRYMAQAISGNMRVPLAQTSSEDTSKVTGTLLNAQLQPRIVQNRTAKIILQVLLGLIFILTALAVWLTKLHEILPFNPCCIAGMAALFARSRMCDLDDPVGREIMENHGQGFSDRRWSFKLGWWDVHGEVGDGPLEKWYGIDAGKLGEVG